MPWFANSNLPGLCWMAPVNAPRSNPNSSDSSSSDGSAAQLTLTNGLVPPRRRLVDGARDQLLAGTALAANQHGDVGVGDARDEFVNFAHLLVAAEQDAGDPRAAALPRRCGIRCIRLDAEHFVFIHAGVEPPMARSRCSTSRECC